MVDFEDGSSRTIHANHLCKFHTKTQNVSYETTGLSGEPDVNSCAVASEQDQDFGDLHAFDYDCAVNGVDGKDGSQLAGRLIDGSSLSHLSVRQKSELLQVLYKYADCFSARPGVTTRVEHGIDITHGFKPKRMRE